MPRRFATTFQWLRQTLRALRPDVTALRTVADQWRRAVEHIASTLPIPPQVLEGEVRLREIKSVPK